MILFFIFGLNYDFLGNRVFLKIIFTVSSGRGPAIWLYVFDEVNFVFGDYNLFVGVE